MPRPARLHVIAPLLAALIVAPLTATAAPKRDRARLKAHIDRAAKAHKQGKFDVALGELQAAYAIDPQPKLLFAIAQVHVKLDNCPAAVEHYTKFLATTKDKQKRAIVEQAIAACDAKTSEDAAPTNEAVATAPEPEPVAEPAPAPEPPAPAPAPPTPALEEPPPPPVPAQPTPILVSPTRSDRGSTAWYRDVLGGALVVTGLGAGVASYLVYRSATTDLDAAEAAPTLDRYNELVDQAESKRLYTLVLGGAGIALVGAGVLRFALRDTGEEPAPVAIVPTPTGGLITWSGGF